MITRKSAGKVTKTDKAWEEKKGLPSIVPRSAPEITHPKDEGTVDESDRSEKDEEGLPKGLILPPVNHQECDHADLHEQ